MKTIIIEDEATLASGLKANLLRLRPEIEISAVTSDVASSVEAIRSNPDVDLIFADIRLEDGYSFDVFEAVDTDAMIVFTTAYDEYALKAFDYDCIDYLLKPYSLNDLSDALERFEKRSIRTTADDSRRVSKNILTDGCKFRKRLELDRFDSKIIADAEDICYAEYDLGSVRVYCRDKISGTTPLSLTRLISELDPDLFVKVSRTHIVNIREVSMIQPTIRRNKILVLKEPYSDVRIELTSEMLRELKTRL